MNESDAVRLCGVLAGLFPNQLSDEQIRFALDEFRACADAAATEAAIKEHRRTCEFVDWPALLRAIRPAAPAAPTGPWSRREGSPAQVIVQQNPKYDTLHPYEVVLRFHRACWLNCGKSPTYAATFRNDCRNMLIREGMVKSEGREGPHDFSWADRAAETIFVEDRIEFDAALQDVLDNAPNAHRRMARVAETANA